jgi:hypothetical protein
MTLRIEQSSIFVTETQDPLVVRVEADVTKDDATVLKPTMYHVSVLWNTTTTNSVLKDLMRAAIKEQTLQERLRTQLGETVITNSNDSDSSVLQAVIINAASVTINETGGTV